MPLVKARPHRRRPYVRVVDDAPVAGWRAGASLPAARFLADAARARRSARAPIGVLWPNDRRVAELAPWLDRLALVALVFPKLQATAAPTARRGILRERYGFRGELRATGDVLRDQFLFLLRAGLRFASR